MLHKWLLTENFTMSMICPCEWAVAMETITLYNVFSSFYSSSVLAIIFFTFRWLGNFITAGWEMQTKEGKWCKNHTSGLTWSSSPPLPTEAKSVPINVREWAESVTYRWFFSAWWLYGISSSGSDAVSLSWCEDTRSLMVLECLWLGTRVNLPYRINHPSSGFPFDRSWLRGWFF